jgi:serine protease inhibitor
MVKRYYVFTAALVFLCSFFAYKMWGNLPKLVVHKQDKILEDYDKNSSLDFALKFYKESKTKDNFVFSPYSVSTIMQVLAQGSSGNSLEDFQKVLDCDKNKFIEDQTRVFSKIKESPRLVFEAARGVWVQKGFALKASYRQFLEKLAFQTRFHPVDFLNNSQLITSQINSFISKQTKGHLVGVVDPSFISSLTRLVALDVLYLRAPWFLPFQEQITKPYLFNLNSESKFPHLFMFQTNIFPYEETKDFQSVRLPLQADVGVPSTFFVAFILPKGKLEDFEEGLDAQQLTKALFGNNLKNIDFGLPKFSVSKKFSLKTTLQRLGLENLFNQKVDFSRMTIHHELMLSDVLHASKISVDEVGVEGAETSLAAVGMLSKKTEKALTRCILDSPFLFFLGESTTKTIFFMGRVADPSSI